MRGFCGCDAPCHLYHQEHVRGGNPGIHAGEEPRSLAKLKMLECK